MIRYLKLAAAIVLVALAVIAVAVVVYAWKIGTALTAL